MRDVPLFLCILFLFFKVERGINKMYKMLNLSLSQKKKEKRKKKLRYYISTGSKWPLFQNVFFRSSWFLPHL
ncbi:hypothetical protein QBC38DRAFT_474475 [Podospora fimiseda]|uniref:Uncharacterized protein n=1 Tax=Podospora fimiseda TaxID=252190 RepID=A0AAN7BSF7_9PEZI|nr:hypothetical protein QBC38DRAFT_474475 [Podospora fimiseda]